MPCGETKYIPEDLELTFSPVIDCLSVTAEGESLEGCGGAMIVMRNGCTEPVVFSVWQFTCDGVACASIQPGKTGKTPIDIETGAETASFTFDGSLGLESLQVVVNMNVDIETPGCAVGGAAAAPVGPLLIGLALILGRRAARRRRPAR